MGGLFGWLTEGRCRHDSLLRQGKHKTLFFKRLIRQTVTGYLVCLPSHGPSASLLRFPLIATRVKVYMMLNQPSINSPGPRLDALTKVFGWKNVTGMGFTLVGSRIRPCQGNNYFEIFKFLDKLCSSSYVTIRDSRKIKSLWLLNRLFPYNTPFCFNVVSD
jgi:hypothetical protein